MKYIRFSRGLVIFSETMSHSDMAKAVDVINNGRPVSAGFVHAAIEKDKASAGGRSLTLDLRAQDEDAALIIQELNRYY